MIVRWDIPGWFNFTSFYDEVSNLLPKPCHAVEVGVLFGSSARYLAERLAIARGSRFKLDLVDTFDVENLGPEALEIATKHGGFRAAFEHYTKNTILSQPNIRVLQMPSISAATHYEKESLDFVFLDGAHDTETVKKEIEAFLPRIKTGGILAGHDISQRDVLNAVVCKFGPYYWERKHGDVWMKKI